MAGAQVKVMVKVVVEVKVQAQVMAMVMVGVEVLADFQFVMKVLFGLFLFESKMMKFE